MKGEKEMTDTTVQMISLIATVIAGIFMYYERKNKKQDNFLERYFVKVLNPYVVQFKDNSRINTVKFIRKKLDKSIKKDKFYIPCYIEYLVKANDKEKLHKVLITDYIENYPNKKNKKWKIVNNFAECLGIIGMFMSYLFLSLSLLMICISLLELIVELLSTMSINVISECIGTIFFFVILFLVGIFIFIPANKSETDQYSLKKKEIERHIKSKIKYYDKNSLEYYI